MATAEQLITDNLDIWTSAISAKSNAGRGSSNKTELYGIKSLRRLILGLALSGNLVDSQHKLGDDFDEKIFVARKKYEESEKKKLKDYRIGPALLKEFQIPTGWNWMRVSHLCDIQTGATPSRQHPEYFGGNIKWLVSGDINQGEIFDCEGRITEAGLNSSNCKILPDNTVLIALNGQGKTRATVAILRTAAACNQSLVGIIPIDSSILDAYFLLWALRYRYFEIRDITGQNQRRGLNMGLVAELSIPVPPIDTQKEIVAKVDELMALCDQLEQQTEASIAAHQTLVETLLGALTNAPEHASFQQAWQRIAEHFDTLFTTEHSIDQLKQTILQLAVMGKLVPQDPNDEPASELLKRVEAKKERLIKEGVIKKKKDPLPINEEETPFQLPKGWEWCKFGLLAEFINGDRSKNYPNKSEYVSNGIPWINTGHIEPDGTLTEKSMNYISKAKFDSLRSGKIEPNDLVYCLRGATFGKTAFVTPYTEGAIASSLMIIRPHINELGGYFYNYLISPHGKSQIFRFDNGSAQPNLSANSVMLYAFPCPPLQEQERINARVQKLMMLCNNLKACISEIQVTKTCISDAITEQAIA